MKTKIPRRSYTPEFKSHAVALVAQGHQSAHAVARDLDIHPTNLRDWMRQAGVPNKRERKALGQTQLLPSAIPANLVEALSPTAIAKFHAGRPKTVTKAQTLSRDPAELMVLLDLKPQDLEPLQRIKMLADRTGMSTRELVNELLDLAVVEGIKRKGDRE